MSWMLATAFFLTLYPLSVAFNAAHGGLRHPVARFGLLLLWPQVGVALWTLGGGPLPPGFLAWALATSAFYALRLLTVRDLGRYAATQATSAMALAWGLAYSGAHAMQIGLFVLALSLPVAALSLLDGALARRFGAAHAGLCPGLGGTAPRLAGLLVVTALAAAATPPFPGFFVVLDLLRHLPGPALPVVLIIWLLWGWASARLIQGFITGTRHEGDHGDGPMDGNEGGIQDASPVTARLGAGVLVVFVAGGFYLAGVGT